MKENIKNQSILQTDHHVQFSHALLVKMQFGLASYLKTQRCENCKRTLNFEQYIKELILTLITPEQTNCQNTGHVSQTEEDVSSL